MKKNGFVSTSLIYTFFILFLMLMLFLLNSYSSNRFLLERYKYDIKNKFAEDSGADINVYFLVFDDFSQEYELEDNMTGKFNDYNYENELSYCKNGSTIEYIDNEGIQVTSKKGKDFCYAYFKPKEKDFEVRIFTKENNESDKVRVNEVPGVNYDFSQSESFCTHGTLEFDNANRTFKTSEEKTKCDAVFVKAQRKVEWVYYIENKDGTETIGGKNYSKADSVPEANYVFTKKYTCKNKNGADVTDKVTIKSVQNQLIAESGEDIICNVFYDGTGETVNLIIMQEDSENNNAVSGYTTGKKYIEVISPSSGYGYVGYKCKSSSGKVVINNGVPEGTSEEPTTCYAYYDKYVSGVLINYHLQKSDGTYENVSMIPNLGYVYSNGSCIKGSPIKVVNNVVEIQTTDENLNEECNVYFDLIKKPGIQMLIYVDGILTKEIPKTGVKLVSKGCTNGASIDYINNKFKVRSKGPTVCTVRYTSW